jgi:tRNA pseudouridine13 synthase
MEFDPRQPLPFVTADLPGIGGQIKQQPEDFEVEEIPAYAASGQGEYLFLWIEKRDVGAEYFVRQIARRLGLRPEEVGTAGLKDRRAVTRQWVSVPVAVEPLLASLDGDGIRLLQVARHGNKLKPGHLHGNRFRIRVGQVDPSAAQRLPALLERLQQHGLPNFYGPQRFGKAGETLELGLRLLLGGKEARGSLRERKFLRKLALSAVQSALFNSYLSRRLLDRLLDQVLLGDVMAKWPYGGLFIVTDLPREQERFTRRETVHTGPMFGRKMLPTAGQAAEREEAILRAAGLTASSFAGFGKLLQGTRRHNLVYLDDLAGTVEGTDALLTFTLPAGSYATILLREVMKREDLAEQE